MKHAVPFFFKIALVALLLCGCAGIQPSANLYSVQPYRFDTREYAPKVDHFIVVLDASESMDDRIAESTKFDQAKHLAGLMGQTLPELSYQAGLRTFGHSPRYSDALTESPYGLTRFQKSAFQSAIDGVTAAGGTSPMAEALTAAGEDLRQTDGQIAVVAISDGLQMPDAPAAARALKETYSDRLCIYSVWVGENPEGGKIMETIADVGGCGFSTDADDLNSARGMAAFIEKVFIRKVEVVRTPPPEPAAGRIAARPLDSDGDGVADEKDRCPGTPAGAKVDDSGCWALHGPLFDFDKAVVQPAYYPELDAVAKIMRQNPGMKLEIQGHTCSIGPENYNQRLSERRARAVADYLIGKGIDADQITTKGFGESSPAFSNDTMEGREKNRRVTFEPL